MGSLVLVAQMTVCATSLRGKAARDDFREDPLPLPTPPRVAYRSFTFRCSLNPNIRTFPGPFYKYFKRKDIFLPANMTPGQLKHTFTIPLRVRKSGLAAKWAARTGGIDGKKNFKLGIEANQMPNSQVLQWFVNELSKVITIDLAAIAKYREMNTLKTAMQSFALKKLQISGSA